MLCFNYCILLVKNVEYASDNYTSMFVYMKWPEAFSIVGLQRGNSHKSEGLPYTTVEPEILQFI